MNARRRTAALLEVLGVYIAGQLVMNVLTGALNVRLVNPLADFTVDITDAELITSSGEFLVLLLFQYAGWFLLIIPINWWHRRRGPAAYGLTRAGHSWPALLLAGVATAALAAWPIFALQLVDTVYQLGDTVAWRQALFATSWQRWEFWLFTAVMSWGLVAVVEELFYRGYCQRRLAEDWGDGAAIIGSACMFTFAHSQYLILNPYNVGMVAGLLTLAIAFGVVFAWTRSLVPSMVAHSIINVTMTPFWQAVALALFVVVAAIAARKAAASIRRVFSRARALECAALTVLGTAYVIASRRIDALVFVAAAMLVLAVVLEAADRTGRRAAEPVAPSA